MTGFVVAVITISSVNGDVSLRATIGSVPFLGAAPFVLVVFAVLLEPHNCALKCEIMQRGHHDVLAAPARPVQVHQLPHP